MSMSSLWRLALLSPRNKECLLNWSKAMFFRSLSLLIRIASSQWASREWVEDCVMKEASIRTEWSGQTEILRWDSWDYEPFTIKARGNYWLRCWLRIIDESNVPRSATISNAARSATVINQSANVEATETQITEVGWRSYVRLFLLILVFW